MRRLSCLGCAAAGVILVVLCMNGLVPLAGPISGFSALGAEGTQPGPRVPVLHGCRVRLVDEAVLAGDRAGILQYVATSEGARVKSGDAVAQIRDTVIRATLAISEKNATNDVEVRYAAKASELAQLEYTKAVRANQELPGTYTEFQIRELRLAAEKSLLQLEQAETNLAVERLKREETLEVLKTYRIDAPFDGMVRVVHKRQGEAVHEGEPILEIVSTERVRVEGYVPVTQLRAIAAGAAVEVQLERQHLAQGEAAATFSGRIVFVDVKVEPVSQQVKVWAEVQNRENILKDGLTAVMAILPSAPASKPESGYIRQTGGFEPAPR